MLSAHDRLCPNDREVAAKVMDGEAILINLGTGLYYSMDNVGGVLWSLIQQRRTIQDIAASLARVYSMPEETTLADVLELAGELLSENLVLVTDEAPSHAQPDPEPFEELPYEKPRLQTYRDMADLLALDPPMPGLKEVPWYGSTDPLPSQPEDGQ